MKPILRAAAVTVFAASATAAQAGFIISSASGPDAAAIQAGVDSFRGSLGALNPNIAGSFASGRREINWDGVPDTASAPNNLAANFFNSNSPRGVVFSTAGSGFQVSANAVNPTSTPIEFGNINPGFPALFRAFSAQRLFTAVGSNVLDVTFFVPGSSQAATSTAFGVVFTDVDLANSTTLQFFDVNGVSMGTVSAPNVAGNETLSFIGLRFDAGERFGRVRITSGGQALSGGAEIGDYVVMDDFIYAEPISTAVPEPTTLAMLAAGSAALLARRRRQVTVTS
ncbi:MAG: PEP-CTERM sorting domain-containing protein [Rubrivivax sp.]